MSILKVSTFCSGIGSPEVALKNLGIQHEVVLTAEIDKYARQTYLANHSTKKMINDMTVPDYEGKEWYSDINISGLPCQSFSLAGKRLGELDPRGLLFFDFYRYVKNQKPKYFIIENVKGLLSSKSCITYENTLYLLLHNFNEIKEWEQLNFQKNSLSTLGQTISLYLLQNFAKKLNLKMDKSATSFNTKSELSYERLETKVKSGLKRRLKFLEERICQITKKLNFYPQELTVPLGCKESDLVLNQKQSYLIENLIPMVTRILENTVDINANTSLFANNILEDNSKNGKLYTTLTELNSTTELKTFMYVLESNIIRLIILALDLSPNLWKEIWLILTQKKEFIGLKTFDIWKCRLKNLMYNLHWQVLNTKDYGLPQNRERVFLIGIRNDLPNSFVFPKKIPLELRLKDILEDEVDEKYYLSDTAIKGFINHAERHAEKGNGFKFSPTDGEGIAVTLTTHEGSRGYNNFLKVENVGNTNPSGNGMNGNVFSENGISPTLTTNKGEGIKVKIGAIRGRNPENKSDRTTGAPTQQMLEINENGTSNCLTSVQKDNLVVEVISDIIQLNNPTHSNDRIYSDEGICPTINTMQGGNRQPFIAQYTGIAVHPLSKKLEFEGFKDGNSPALLATDYKAPKCVQYSDYRIRKLTPLECFRLQGFPDEFVDKNNFIKSINKQGILVYICNEFKNRLLCNAKLKNVIEKQKEGDIALCTIKDSESMGTQISFLNTPIEEIKNAKYQVAIKLFTQKDFVYHTTTPIENMETLYTLTKEGNMLSTELSHLVEKEELGNVVDQNTDLLLKITLGESWKIAKSYITSTLIHTIMKSVICMCTNPSQNTLRCIVSYEELPKKQKQPTKNSFEMESFILKTASTSYVSSSQLYKQAGNSISVPVIQAILKKLL